MPIVAKLLVAVALFMPAAQATRYGLQGHVMFEGVISIPAVQVRLEGLDTRHYATTVTNPAGRFLFTDVPQGIYDVVVTRDGEEAARERVTLPQYAGVWILVKRRYESPSDESEPAVGGRHTVDVRQLSIPQEAVEEYEKAYDSVRNGDTDHAIVRFRKALALAPDFHEAAVALARLRIDREEYDAAIEVLQPDASGESFVPGSAFYLGYALYQLNQYDAAEFALLKSLESDQVMPATRLMLANVYIKRGDAGKALSHIEAYLEEYPDADGRALAEQKRLELIEFLKD